MFAPERHQRIMSALSRTGTVTVAQITEELGVSAMTVRRDLQTLEEQGFLMRTHGGAILPDRNPAQEIPYASKSAANIQAKRLIGQRAAELVQDGDAIMLDAGSTTLEVARNLKASPLVVVTNDTAVAYTLGLRQGVTVIVPGGIMQENLYTLIHPTASQFISDLRVQKLFLGADALHMEHGVTNRTLVETPSKQAMIRAAQEVILVTDSSKFGKEVFARVCGLDAIHRVITDKGAPEEIVEKLREMGIVVDLV